MKQPLQRTEKPCVMCVQYLISYANYAINLSQAEILTSHKSYSTTFDPCSMDLKSFIPLEKAYNMTSLRRFFGKKKRNLTNLFQLSRNCQKSESCNDTNDHNINDHQSYVHIDLSSCENRARKNSSLNGIQTHDLCDTGAVLYQLSDPGN